MAMQPWEKLCNFFNKTDKSCRVAMNAGYEMRELPDGGEALSECPT